MQRGLMTMKWQSMITKKTWDKRVVIFHKSTSDGGALAMVCGRDEEPRSSVTVCWKIVMTCACYKTWTHVVDNKKQASRELKTILDDA